MNACASTSRPAPGAIEVRELTKRYGEHTALDRVSFTIEPGGSLGLWGPNGAGKTTIIRCLLGLARYDGDVRVGGLTPDRRGREVRRQIGYVPQDLPVMPMTVGEAAQFVARLKSAPFSEAEARLSQLGIGGELDKTMAALSGGMKQRLALALALIGKPSVLLLDEPTANLDARGRAELLDLLGNLKREGLTIVLCSHRPDDVARLSDRVLMLEAGQVQALLEPPAFLRTVEGDARMVVTLKNGHLPEALAAMRELGMSAEGAGHVLTIRLQPGRKAEVLSTLTNRGVAFVDFELEREQWNVQS